MVSSPPAVTARAWARAETTASSVAQKRVPTRTPSAPRASAPASPRPSATPPAPSRSVSGARSAISSATSGTRVNVDRVPTPCPPASPPCVTMTSAPASRAWRAWSSVWTWHSSGTAAARIRSANGAGSPKDSMTAAGWCSRAMSSSSGWRARFQVMKPASHPGACRGGELPLQPLSVAVAAADQAQSARGGHRGGEPGPGDEVHGGEQDGVLDSEGLGKARCQQGEVLFVQGIRPLVRGRCGVIGTVGSPRFQIQRLLAMGAITGRELYGGQRATGR